jgi:FkbM family methyltransferase
MRASFKRLVRATLGDPAEFELRALSHRIRRKVGRFAPPEQKETRALLCRLSAASKTIVDVGANIGLYTVLFAEHSPASVFAFEPNPTAFRLLIRNTSRFPTVFPFEIALAEFDSRGLLVVPEDARGNEVDALSWLVQTPEARGELRRRAVPIRSLDSLLHEGTIEISPPVFLKLDVEGSEIAVLRGSLEVLARHRPVVFFECVESHLARAGHSAQELWRLFHEIGYVILRPDVGRFRRVAAPNAETANYLAVPTTTSGDPPEFVETDQLTARPPINGCWQIW